jgi:hypothetical protein
MLQLIGFSAVVYLSWVSGIAQAALSITAGLLLKIASIG